jgi:hypothetical protein
LPHDCGGRRLPFMVFLLLIVLVRLKLATGRDLDS